MATTSIQTGAPLTAQQTKPTYSGGTVQLENKDRKSTLTIAAAITGVAGAIALGVALLGGRGGSRASTPVLITGVALLAGSGGSIAAKFMTGNKSVQAVAVDIPTPTLAEQLRATMNDRVTSVVRDVVTGKYAVVDHGPRGVSAPSSPLPPAYYRDGYLPDYGPHYHDPYGPQYRERYYDEYNRYPDYSQPHYRAPEYRDDYPYVPSGGYTSPGDTSRYPDPYYPPSNGGSTSPGDSRSYPPTSGGDRYPASGGSTSSGDDRSPAPAPRPGSPSPQPTPAPSRPPGNSTNNGNPRVIRDKF